ncbi:MAG: carboxypeptidase M32 [Verrucomicrobiales bacterium]|nr:carboxypeptidase M32 [Verrucomicrobiales bacterium]
MNHPAYQKLVDLSNELKLLSDAAGLLSWDQEVNMAKKGVGYRARQMAWFSGEYHARFTAPEVGDWISECEENVGDLDPESDSAANLREWRHGYDRETKLPADLVTEFARVRSLAHESWAEAREKSEFTHFAPDLEKLIGLCKQQAECWGYEDKLYDALLDKYERGSTTAEITAVFADLKKELVPLVEEACSQEPFDPVKVGADYSIEKQQAFNREVAEAVGFDFEAGRIDTAVHPFCTGLGPLDTRLTTRYMKSDFRSSLYGVLHETGHGLYDQGLREEDYGLPIGDAVSLGVHESQSRLWENQVGRSPEFWDRWLPKAAEYFPNLAELSVEEMTRACNQAERSFIRVEADEVTYDLHIMLRFEMESAIFNDELPVAEIPAEWNRRFKESFGLEVDNDSNGCLQDIHWSMGGFGYFPTYSLGNLNASHLFKAAKSQDSEIETGLANGNYTPLLQWMRTRIHEPGSRFLPKDLVERAAGSPVTADAHLAHLRSRYLFG